MSTHLASVVPSDQDTAFTTGYQYPQVIDEDNETNVNPSTVHESAIQDTQADDVTTTSQPGVELRDFDDDNYTHESEDQDNQKHECSDHSTHFIPSTSEAEVRETETGASTTNNIRSHLINCLTCRQIYLNNLNDAASKLDSRLQALDEEAKMLGSNIRTPTEGYVDGERNEIAKGAVVLGYQLGLLESDRRGYLRGVIHATLISAGVSTAMMGLRYLTESHNSHT
ncbi:hypothetical protein TREMEDRAFT_60464 [Tremella mesenterica DSM 1558]|uniref:uncharacterized protein n=1 Tax=Tremella mesenterica (strain ATCC 24925 / CBS 8224 / DSM 1558 / NBRC 9311 / NRRL Y-6157 / RJB 2259-6 / UBC 559-6) TaxID=578456 RepID=UPI0003F4A1F2|nr:uncharacterized protein TREMEDRAFT_60464 [Tremella mesenterica DSM 1558]EIW71540.1 hypothetical protein TREMEDRAFT_60464 [Tremella mesenterica DSM 1558]